MDLPTQLRRLRRCSGFAFACGLLLAGYAMFFPQALQAVSIDAILTPEELQSSSNIDLVYRSLQVASGHSQLSNRVCLIGGLLVAVVSGVCLRTLIQLERDGVPR